MRIILKDIDRLNSIYQGGEPDEIYFQRRLSVEKDNYTLEGDDEDITSISNWHKLGATLCTDHLQVRERVMDAFSWGSATDTEKNLLIEYFATDRAEDSNTNDTYKVEHLMSTKGLSLEQSMGHLIQCYAKFHTKEKESCKARANSEKVSEVMLTYLTIPDASDFLHTVDGLLRFYSEQGVFGSVYGSAGIGIIDYIDNTVGTVYENAGLSAKGYVYNGGATAENFKDAIKDVLLNGNY